MRTIIRLVPLAIMIWSICICLAAPPLKDARQPEPGSELSHLRLMQLIRRPFQLNFDEIRNGRLIVRAHPLQLSIDPNPNSGKILYTLGVGDQLPEKKEFVITRITPKTANMPQGITVDVSEVAVRNTRTNEETVLTRGAIIASPITYASLTTSDGSSQLIVKVGTEFEFPKASETKYRLLEIGAADPAYAIIQKVATGETFRIPSGKPAP